MSVLWNKDDVAPKQFDWAFIMPDNNTNEMHIRIANKAVITSPLAEPNQAEPIKYGLGYIAFRTKHRWYYAIENMAGLHNCLQYMEAEEPKYIKAEEE